MEPLLSSLFANGNAGKYAKKLLGDKEIENIFQKLDKFATEEAQIRGTQILAGVYELVSNMALAMKGACSHRRPNSYFDWENLVQLLVGHTPVGQYGIHLMHCL